MKGWVKKPLGEVTTKIGSGATPLGGEAAYKKEGIALFRSLNVYDDGFREEGLARIDDQQAARLSNVIVEPNDVLLNITGASVARCCVAPEGLLPARVNQHVSIIRPRPKILDSAFLHYLLIAPDCKKTLLNTGEEGGSTRQAITKAQLQDFVIEFPESLAEQQRIVGVLDEAMAGIATARAHAETNLQNARALFESHLHAVFTQRGPGWVETTLDQATGGVFTGPFGSLLHKHDYIENGIPLVNPAHITDTGIEPDMRKTVSDATAKRLENYIMRAGDLVIGRRGEMGRCALVTEVEDGWLCGTGSFFIRPSDRCDMGYLVRYLRSEGCRKQLDALAGGAVMPNLSNTSLGGLSLFLPPVPEQKKILSELDALSAETQRLAALYERKLAALEELKKSLLHQAFAGEL
ncbi:MAG: hypothetical protein RIS79_1632 [Verrucomicrobiota bacterium]|jgi:type I restriction enzyme S subunit